MKIENKIIAKVLDDLIKGESKIVQYNNIDNTKEVDIIEVVDDETKSQTFGTVNLSNIDINIKTKEGKKLAVEFIMVSDKKYPFVSNVISEAAFAMMDNIDSCRPGSVYSNLLKDYISNGDMKHVLLTYPFLWGDFTHIEYENIYISWLQLVPISDNELEYLQKNSLDKLESLFEDEEIDIFDLDRKSIL